MLKKFLKDETWCRVGRIRRWRGPSRSDRCRRLQGTWSSGEHVKLDLQAKALPGAKFP
jgi:hypothetical protein